MLHKTLKLGLLGLVCLLSGCATPTERIARGAAAQGLTPLTLETNGFLLRAYFAPGDVRQDVLHVYLEGDGTPWVTPTRVADDPTARQPTMLNLMELDPAPRLYLGRPCYMGFAATPPCNSDLWSFGRYGERVVDSMATALAAFLTEHPYPGLIWMGHSGGGALAMLLAPRFPQSRAVITLAGNLDVEAWTRHHGYSPLADSLDPAREAPLPKHIEQWHYLGERDEVITRDMVANAVAAQPGAQLQVLTDVGHNRGWRQHWPAILSHIGDRTPASRGGSAGGDPAAPGRE